MPSLPLTNTERNRKLPWALAGDACNTVYVYWVLAGPVFLLFLDHLKLEKSRIGLLLSIMPLGGLVAIFSGPLSSRVGLKRVFLSCWTIRKFIMASLIFAPWVVDAHGLQAGFWFVAVVMTLFALCRSVGESSLVLWQHEFVPTNRRGNYSAWQTVVIMIVGAASMALAGQFLGEHPHRLRFQVLFAAGMMFGLACVACYGHVPGGQPMPAIPLGQRQGLGVYFQPLRDSRFMRMLLAIGLVNCGWFLMTTFLPLFHRDYVGLRENQIIWLDSFTMLGQLCSCFLWGWTADRYGSKPQVVMVLSMLALYPISLMLLPRHSPYSAVTACSILYVMGLMMPGWTIGFARLLYVDLIPPEKKTHYLPIHLTCGAAVAGVSPLLAGYLLDRMPTTTTTWWWFNIDPYTPFFVFCALTLVAAAMVFATIPVRGKVPVTTFAMMFMQGNPIAAVQAIIAFQYAGHERSRVINVERLGQTNSPLSIEELISALSDPSFNVRHEAIISIARTRHHPRLTQAMLQVLTEGTADLRSTAAWALGRMGDRRAIATLREMLDSPYPLLRSRTARALGVLEDKPSAERIMALFNQESDEGIAVAYAAALGALGYEQANSRLLAFLRQAKEADARQEIALAIATLLGSDGQALRLWRRMIAEPGDTLGGIMIGVRRRLVCPDLPADVSHELGKTFDQCIRLLSMEDFGPGVVELRKVIAYARPELYKPLAQAVLVEVDQALAEHGPARMEYITLAIHTLHMGMIESAK